MRNIKWYLFVFYDKDKKELIKIMDFDRIKDLSYIVNQDSQVVSNYFHNLIKPRGLLQYCYIYQFKTQKINSLKNLK